MRRPATQLYQIILIAFATYLLVSLTVAIAFGRFMRGVNLAAAANLKHRTFGKWKRFARIHLRKSS
jgi:hypothetical protein